MKRIVALLMIGMLIFSISACSETVASTESNTSSEVSSVTNTESEINSENTVTSLEETSEPMIYEGPRYSEKDFEKSSIIVHILKENLEKVGEITPKTLSELLGINIKEIQKTNDISYQSKDYAEIYFTVDGFIQTTATALRNNEFAEMVVTISEAEPNDDTSSSTRTPTYAQSGQILSAPYFGDSDIIIELKTEGVEKIKDVTVESVSTLLNIKIKDIQKVEYFEYHPKNYIEIYATVEHKDSNELNELCFEWSDNEYVGVVHSKYIMYAF